MRRGRSGFWALKQDKRAIEHTSGREIRLIADLSAGGQSTPDALACVTVSGLCRFVTVR
jgi:hypothetical protein